MEYILIKVNEGERDEKVSMGKKLSVGNTRRQTMKGRQ